MLADLHAQLSGVPGSGFLAGATGSNPFAGGAKGGLFASQAASTSESTSGGLLGMISGTSSGSPFGGAAAGGLFGGGSSSSSPFGASGGGAFGGASSASPFGSSASGAGLFGGASGASPFGSSASTGGLFGGGSSSSPFGGLGATSGGLFGGGSGTSPFGGSSSSSPFGGGASASTASSGGLFGASSGGLVAGGSSSSSPFGGGATSGGLFGGGSSGTSPFGGSASSGGGLFTGGASSSSPFGGSAASGGLFGGGSSGSPFGGSASSGGGLFSGGASSSSPFGGTTSGGLFGGGASSGGSAASTSAPASGTAASASGRPFGAGSGSGSGSLFAGMGSSAGQLGSLGSQGSLSSASGGLFGGLGSSAGQLGGLSPAPTSKTGGESGALSGLFGGGDGASSLSGLFGGLATDSTGSTGSTVAAEEPRPDTPALEELVLELTKSSTDPPTKPAVPAAPPASPCGKGAVAALASQKAKQREFPEVLDDGAAQSGSSRCGGSMCGDFPFCTARCPFLVACLTLVATPLLLILLWPGLVINSDTSVFLEADSRSSSIRSAFLGALPFRDAEAEGRRLMTGLMPHIDVKDMYKMDHLILYWSTTDPKGLLQEKYLRPMRALELSLQNGPLYQLTCHEMSTPGLGAMCDPGHSVVNAAYPSEAVNASETDPYIKKPMDGRGTQLLRPDVIQKVISEKDDYKELMLPRNYQDGDVVMMARSYFGWNMLCCRIDVPNSVRGAELMRIRGVWDKLLATEVIPKLVDFQQKNLLLQRNLRLNFDGGGVSTMQLWDVLQSDCLFAIGSVLFIITYLTIHAGSPLLSCGSMLLTMLAIPMAFLVTALVSGSNEVTGAAFLSIFLIAGLGADVVLVFINFWARSKTSTPEPPTPCTSTAILGARKRQRDANSTFERVKYVYRHAGLACLGTTLTTAASFFANLASVLRALREFGFFMGMCILGAYLYLLLVLPALLILNDCLTSLRCSKRCAEACAGGVRRLCRCRPPSSKGLCERLILAYRRCCFLFFLILVVAFGVWTGTVARLDVGVPQMFPDGHNLNDVEDIAEDFLAASERWTRDELRICNFLVHEDRRNFMQCAVHQCQITLEGPLTFMGSSDRNGSAECDCFPSELESSQCHMVHPGEEGYILIRVRVVGDVPHEAIEQWRGTAEFRDYAMQAAILANPMLQSEIEAGMNKSFFRWARSGPGHALQQEFWETGEIITTNYEVLANFAIPVKRTDRSIQVCHADRLCYCGAAICTYPGRRLVDPVIPDIFFLQRLTIPLLVAPTVPPRLLLAADVAVTEGHPGHFAFGPSVAPMATAPAPFGRRLQGGVDVSLVWGLRTNDLMPLLGQPERAWHFEAAFRMDAPSTQRQLFAACSLGKDKPELLVQETACWVKNFRSYVKMAGLPFPLQSTWFQSTFSKFVDGRVLPSGILVKDYMWLAENFELKATYVQFTVGLNYMTAQSSTILSLMQEWDNVVDEINQNAPPELGSTWHTSSLWIRAEAELAIVNSTVLTMLVSAICGFLGALFFTHWDPFLSLMVVVNVIGVTLALAWFMMVLMGWAVGVLEVLGLIVFVGYSITYTLHIAHKYQEHILSSESIQLGRRTRERRTLAVSYALRSMSGSIVGSAITTLGSSLFLFFCQLVIFVKLATVLFSVTFFACVFATFAFPAALLCVGPVGTSCEVLPQLWKSYSAPGSDGPDHPRVHSEAERVQMSSKLAKKIVVDDGVASHVFLASGSTSSLPRRSSDAAQEKRPRKSQDLAITVL